MKKNILLLVMSLTLLGSMLGPLSLPSVQALSGPANDVCTGASLAGTSCSGGTDTSSINSALAFVINLLASIVGVAAVTMIIVAGFKFITSGGDPSKITSAKSSVIYALIGLIVVALSQVLVHFVLNNVHG